MKLIAKLVPLFGAVALVLCVTAASASAATVLCESEENTCEAANVAPAGSWYTLGVGSTVPGSEFKLLNSGKGIQCTGALIGAQTTTESGSQLWVNTSGLLSGCSFVSANKTLGTCSGTVGNSTGWIMHTATSDTLAINNNPAVGTFSFHCEIGGEQTTCTYGGELVVTGHGSEMAIHEESMTRTSQVGFWQCPTTALLNVKGADVSRLYPAFK